MAPTKQASGSSVERFDHKDPAHSDGDTGDAAQSDRVDQIDTERLRQLVDAPRATRSVEQRRRRTIRTLGIVLAALVVVASLIFAVTVIARSVGSADAITDIFDPSTDDEPQRAVVFEPAEGAGRITLARDDPWAQLRHLSVDRSAASQIASLVRLESAAPLAAWVRDDAAQIPAVVLIDATDAPVPLSAAEGHQAVAVAGEDGLLLAVGAYQQQLVAWTHPTLGPLRAWGHGLAGAELVALVNDIDLVERSAAADPDGWRRISAFTGAAPGPNWRASFFSADGDPLLVSVGLADGPQSAIDRTSCTVTTVQDYGAFACDSVLAWIDNDGAEVLIFGDGDAAADLAESLRPTPPTSQLIVQQEFQPFETLPMSSARSLAYLPDPDSRWTLDNATLRWDSEPVHVPTLVLVERDRPVIGEITSSVVFAVLPPGSAEVGYETFDDNRTALTVMEGERLLRINGWNHSRFELAGLRHVVSTNADGELDVGIGALRSLGLRRQYETTFSSSRPQIAMHGLTMTSTYTAENGTTIRQTVSHIPAWSPEAALADPRYDTVQVSEVRGHDATVVTRDGDTIISWEERQGLLIQLQSGDVEAETIQRLADELQLTDIDDSRLAAF